MKYVYHVLLRHSDSGAKRRRVLFLSCAWPRILLYQPEQYKGAKYFLWVQKCRPHAFRANRPSAIASCTRSAVLCVISLREYRFQVTQKLLFSVSGGQFFFETPCKDFEKTAHFAMESCIVFGHN
jgi:hypothetical protein